MAMQESPLPEMVLLRTMAWSLERWSMMPALRLSYTTLFWMETSLHRLEAMIPWLPGYHKTTRIRNSELEITSKARPVATNWSTKHTTEQHPATATCSSVLTTYDSAAHRFRKPRCCES